VGCVFLRLKLTAAKGEERTEANSGYVMKRPSLDARWQLG